MKSEHVNELATALAKAQGDIKNAVVNKTNPHFKNKYADLSSVRDSIQAPLAKNGLAYTQVMEIRENGMVLVTTLWHTSGQWIASEYPLPATARPQEMGSALTYARRYSLSAIVGNSADEDDDAEGAETAKQQVEASGKTRQQTVVLYTEAEERKVIDGLTRSIEALTTENDVDAFGKQPESRAIYARCSVAGQSKIQNALRTQRDKVAPPSMAGAA